MSWYNDLIHISDTLWKKTNHSSQGLLFFFFLLKEVHFVDVKGLYFYKDWNLCLNKKCHISNQNNVTELKMLKVIGGAAKLG